MAGIGVVAASVSMRLAKTPPVNPTAIARSPANCIHVFIRWPGEHRCSRRRNDPVICGRKVRVGSFVVSAGIFTERFVPDATG